MQKLIFLFTRGRNEASSRSHSIIDRRSPFCATALSSSTSKLDRSVLLSIPISSPMLRCVFVLISISVAAMIFACHAGNALHPLVLIPGNGGNQLEARLTKDYKPSSLFCCRWSPLSKDRDGWFRLWFDPSVLIAPFTDCFAHRMTLHFDPNLDDFTNCPGVQTRVLNFGSTKSLLYLDPHLKQIIEYMASLVDSLEDIGYVEGETLFGAPYDFRYGLAPEGRPSNVGSKYLNDLKELVENASASNEGKKVILVSHSLGGLFALQLLNRNKPAWRQKFIKHLVALATPWAGSVVVMRTFASGNTLGVPFVKPLKVRDEQRSSESNLWLLPNPKIFGTTKLLVTTQNSSYTANDTAQFLNDIGYPQGVYPFESRIRPLMDQLGAPEVPVTCLFGSGVKTAETLFYGENGFDEEPEIVYGDGDGTVNMASLSAVESLWENDRNQSLKMIKINGVSHASVLKDEAALNQIIKEISCINSPAMAAAM